MSAGRDHYQVVELEPAEVVGDEQQRRHVVDRLAEEALNLAGVQIDREQPVHAGRLEQLRDETGGVGSRSADFLSWRE